MILDAQAQFSDAQAVTAAAASTNVIDLGPIFGSVGRDIGTGKPLYIVFNVDVAMTDAGSDSTVAVALEQDDNEGFASATAVQSLFTVPATSAIGFSLRAVIAPGAVSERYIRLQYTPANGNLTTGTFTCGIVETIDEYTNYPNAYTITG